MEKDLDLQREVLEELEFEPSVDAADIGVAAKHGVVTLSGYVDSFAEKLAAEKAAQRVQGVRGVALDVEVRIPSDMHRNDTEIATSAVAALEWNSMVPRDRVTVRVEEGWITLEGTVEWAYQREAAARAVRPLTGVRGVTNFVRIAPRVATEEIKGRILGAFRRSAELDAGGIEVEAVGGIVTLSGKVRSWSERSEAERAAWAAPGVSLVANHITVGH